MFASQVFASQPAAPALSRHNTAGDGSIIPPPAMKESFAGSDADFLKRQGSVAPHPASSMLRRQDTAGAESVVGGGGASAQKAA